MIITDEIKLKWHGSNRKYYENIGYKYGGLGNEFKIKVNELPDSSIIRVTVKCDNCNKIFNTKYLNYKLKLSHYGKDLCKTCVTKNSNIQKYGVDNVAKVKEIKEKIVKTNLDKYGTKYGLSNNDIRNKIKNTCLNKYGVENVFQARHVKDKIKKTNLKKYGFENNLNNPNIREKAVTKSRKTLFYHGKAPCSKQQLYIYNLVGGILNYPVDRCSLDIAFPEEMIYIEYDGGGHDLSVKLGADKNEFKLKQIKRQKYLNSNGWKIIRIKSNKDYLPEDDILINLIKYSKNYLIDNFWIEIDIDNEIIITKSFNKKIKLDNLKRL